MRAVIISQPGGPEVLQPGDVAMPVPGPRQILVRVHATAINRADLLQRRGMYPAPAGAPAQIPGLEYAGEVIEGEREREREREGVSRWHAGDRVMGIIGGGGYAEYVVVHEDEAMPIPANLSYEEAAAIPEVFLTAYDALQTRLNVQSGDTVLIHAVASGVGTAAAQLAHQSGCFVIGTARSQAKLDQVARYGVDLGIDTSRDNFVEVIRAKLGDRGVNAIVDLVGGDYLTGNVQCLALLGRIAVVGLVAGRTAPLDMGMLLSKRAMIVGTAMRSRTLQEKIAVARAFTRDVLPLIESGALVPVIDRVLPADQVIEAHRLVEANETVGKVVLRF